MGDSPTTSWLATALRSLPWMSTQVRVLPFPQFAPRPLLPTCLNEVLSPFSITLQLHSVSLYLSASIRPLGLLTVAWPLARRANSVVQLEIGAQDGGGLQAEPSARVNVSIVPGTPIPPIFEQLQYVFSVPEDVAPGTSVGIVQAHNPPGIIYHHTPLVPDVPRHPNIALRLQLKIP